MVVDTLLPWNQLSTAPDHQLSQCSLKSSTQNKMAPMLQETFSFVSYHHADAMEPNKCCTRPLIFTLQTLIMDSRKKWLTYNLADTIFNYPSSFCDNPGCKGFGLSGWLLMLHQLEPTKHRTKSSTFIMMTSSNGSTFRVNGPLCGEFTCHRWIPLTKANDAEICSFLWSVPQ